VYFSQPYFNTHFLLPIIYTIPIKQTFFLLLLVLISFTVGYFSHQFFTSPAKSVFFSETRNPGKYKFINPLLECDSTTFTEDPSLSSLRSELVKYIDSQTKNQKINFASVYYRDLNNGPWFGIHESELFSPSSLIKVPLMMTYYHLAETDPSILTKEIQNTLTFDPKSQNILPEVTLIPNQKYSIEELINRMIIYSDNNAFDLLNNNLDSTITAKVYKELGVDISAAESDPTGNILSVHKYANFFRILFNSSYLSKDMSEKALKLLSQIKFTQGIVAGVPQDITVSHKFGEREYVETGKKQLHDCGIVYTPNKKPYLICIMTQGTEFSELTSTIKNISQIVYQHLNTN
jgi:beta-lactamase class A